MDSEAKFYTTNKEEDLAETGELRDQAGEEIKETVFKEITREALEDIKKNPLLSKLAKGEFNEQQWRTFAIQRYLAAQPFETLLGAGIEKAKQQGDVELVDVLQENLTDEGAHEQWRKDFYTEMGISATELKETSALEGTKQYFQTLEELIDNEDAVVIAGAILILEGTFSAEFKKIQKGRDINYPNLTDKAKLYLDDHIKHDAKSHYPDLLSALKKYISTDGRVDERILRGAEIIRKARAHFFKSVEINI